MKKESTTILYIEDDPEAFLLLEIILERYVKQKIKLIWASNGKDAIKIIEREEIHLILIDFFLPDICGLDLMDKIRGKGITAPIVMITGNGNEKIAADAFKKGVIDYIVKGEDNINELGNRFSSYIHFASWISNVKDLSDDFDHLCKKRDALSILTKILECSAGGAKKSHILYRANLNSVTIKKYIWYAIKNGYLQWRRKGREGIFFTTMKGMELISKVNKLREILI